MKAIFLTALYLLPFSTTLCAEQQSIEVKLADHQQASAKIADLQDELSADVQQLIIEQTSPQVIELLNQVDTIMDEATDRLAAHDTGGETIAAQTEIIETIHAAAAAKQQQQGAGKSGSAMMDMLERMMGKKQEGEGQGKDKKGDAPGTEGGQGQTGLSDSPNALTEGENAGKDQARRVPKAAGNAGRALPEEFQKALDAYNRGVEQKVK